MHITTALSALHPNPVKPRIRRASEEKNKRGESRRMIGRDLSNLHESCALRAHGPYVPWKPRAKMIVFLGVHTFP
jgi:hypothetical protein